jgi:hypothetical protein
MFRASNEVNVFVTEPISKTVSPFTILRALAQSFPHWIHQDITRLFLQLRVIAQAVVEKVALPWADGNDISKRSKVCKVGRVTPCAPESV